MRDHFVLWVNQPMSPWRKESKEAYRLLDAAGVVVYVLEVSGLPGPLLIDGQLRYEGLSQIKRFIKIWKSSLPKRKKRSK